MNIRAFLGEHILSPRAMFFRIKDCFLSFEDTLSIVCIAKNEAPYIQEWVRFHLCQGADRIYLYDNDSPDDMKKILMPYIQKGVVVYTKILGKGRQLDAYRDAVQRYKDRTKYMAFLDADEFLLPEDPKTSLIETIEAIFRKRFFCGGIAVNWRIYTSSFYRNRPAGYVIQNFIYRSAGDRRGNDCIKTIANPRLIHHFAHVHYPVYFRGLYNINENGKVVKGWSNPTYNTKYIRINHYFTKSLEEWNIRRSAGKADTIDETDKRSLSEFYEHDHNDLRDAIALQYLNRMSNYD